MRLLLDPVYGEDYKDGYVFFSYHNDSFVSKGIALFQMCESVSGQSISHCGIISGNSLCISATTPKTCEENFMEAYVNDPHTVVFLRKPIGMDVVMAAHFIEEARKYLGKEYSYGGLVGSALYIIFTGGWKICPWLRTVKNPFNSKNKLFCSELVAEVMQHVMGKVGVLKYHPTNIYPSTLFEDNALWTPWDYNIVERKIREGKTVV